MMELKDTISLVAPFIPVRPGGAEWVPVESRGYCVFGILWRRHSADMENVNTP